MALRAKQQRFVDEYLTDLNATRAATRAGYSTQTAQEQGSRLLSNVIVAAAIAARQRMAAERADLTVDAHMAELRALRDGAKAAGQYAAAVAAETRRGEVAGFYVKRRADVTEMSSAERAERVKRLLNLA